MDLDTLNKLLDNEKKSKASKKTRETFEKAWLSYVQEAGFNETAIDYLFKGFEYRFIHPFAEYLKTQENKTDPVQMIFGSNQFYAVKAKSFRVTLNLLAVLLSEMPNELDLIGNAIRRLPDLSLGKDRKRNPEIGKYFGKYFIPELQGDVNYPSGAQLGLTSTMSGLFFSMIHDGLDAYCAAAPDDKLQPVIDGLKKWVADNTSEKLATEPASAEVSSQQDDNIPKQEPKSGFTWKHSITIITNHINTLENRIRDLEQTISLLSEQKERATKENEAIRSQLAAKRKETEDLEIRMRDLEYTISTLNKKIQLLEATIEDKDREIADRIKLADMVSMDRSRQSDATLQRLSSELASYYEDFMSAKDDEITPEIAEILRDQLNDVYLILKKNGISL